MGKDDFIKEVHAASGHRFAQEVFADMVRAMALAVEGQVVFEERKAEVEAEYAALMGKYSEDERQHFYRAFAIVIETLSEKHEEFLGQCLEQLGANNKHNGQFLTPGSVASLMARINMHEHEEHRPGEIIRINDPACGASVLLIAQAEALIDAGVPQGDILAVAGDIDGRACDMSYVQMSFLGYAAVVQHMNALTGERYSPDRYTPGYFLHCMPMRILRSQKGETNGETGGASHRSRNGERKARRRA
jgi:type I restriction-modification system DNA methylase subunit